MSTTHFSGPVESAAGFTGDVTGDVTAATTTILKDASGDILMAQGTTVPADTTSGYAKGALFIDTDVVTGTSGLYVNVGINTSSVFKLVTNA